MAPKISPAKKSSGAGKSGGGKSGPTKKGGAGLAKNKLGVQNSLVNNINAKKKAGTSKSKKDSTVSKKSYEKMQQGWK
jgi:hypothetical protein